ncbi:hypothetical protein SFR_2446 [Streptomyces sp. FR-008]|nr:hypothetical protein SFR_2446 [Streptomyces sp. FR-008]
MAGVGWSAVAVRTCRGCGGACRCGGCFPVGGR